jgi:hypothetical protein
MLWNYYTHPNYFSRNTAPYYTHPLAFTMLGDVMANSHSFIHSLIHPFIRSFRSLSYYLFQSQFSTQYVLMLPLSIYSIVSFSLRSSSSCLRLLPRLPCTSILSSICPLIMCFRRQFLSKMWPIQLALFLCIVCRIFRSSLALYNTSSFLTLSVQQRGRVECFWHHFVHECFLTGVLCGLNGMIVKRWVCRCLKWQNCYRCSDTPCCKLRKGKVCCLMSSNKHRGHCYVELGNHCLYFVICITILSLFYDYVPIQQIASLKNTEWPKSYFTLEATCSKSSVKWLSSQPVQKYSCYVKVSFLF